MSGITPRNPTACAPNDKRSVPRPPTPPAPPRAVPAAERPAVNRARSQLVGECVPPRRHLPGRSRDDSGGGRRVLSGRRTLSVGCRYTAASHCRDALISGQHARAPCIQTRTVYGGVLARAPPLPRPRRFIALYTWPDIRTHT